MIKYGAITVRLHHHFVKRQEAEAACQADGGTLATLPASIRSNLEENITNILSSIGGRYNGISYFWYDEIVLCLDKRHRNFYYGFPYCPGRPFFAFTLCEHRISKSACDSDDDCDSNATCGFDHFTNSSTFMPYDDMQKISQNITRLF